MWKNSDRRDGYIYTLAKNLTFDFIRHKRVRSLNFKYGTGRNMIYELRYIWCVRLN